MTKLDGPVGIRNLTQPTSSFKRDQAKVIDLLWRINVAFGGQLGLGLAPQPGSDRQCEPRLVAAISMFQAAAVLRGELKAGDGVVDPNGTTLKLLDKYVAKEPPPSVPDFREIKGIRIRNRADPSWAKPRVVINKAVLPGSFAPYLFATPPSSAKLLEDSIRGEMSEFLFEIEKDGARFWVGAAIPKGTTDFSKAYVYFHPTVVNGGVVHAAEGDYATFRGGWSERLQRYVSMQGGQMAAARLTTLLVPFMTMGSMHSPASNIFSSRGFETLDVIMTQVQIEMNPGLTRFASLGSVGAASFSSGIEHLARFLGYVGGSGVVRETIDFDSTFIISKHAKVPTVAGAAQWTLAQRRLGVPSVGWIGLDQHAWRAVTTYDSLHSRIGWMTFHSMMTFSGMR